MATLFWDASGLAKFYAEESGSDTARALFADPSRPLMVTTPWGYAETFALIQRKHNGGRIDFSSYSKAVSALRNDMIVLPLFRLLTVTDAAIIGSITAIHKHNLNSTDAALLTTFLRYAHVSPDACVLVAADQRLLRAAQAERLAVINPETMPAAAVAAFLAAL